MKTSKKFKETFSALLLIFTALAGLTSCSSDSEISGNAYVRIVNSSESAPPQDFYLDSSKVNSSAVVYGQNTGYITTTSGNRKARFKTAGTATVNSSSNININVGNHYTVYYTGGNSSSANFTTEDDVVAPAAGKAKVRFVHLSSAAASNVDLAIQGGLKIVSNLAYKTASAYQEVDAASSFQLFASGSSTAALTLSNLSLQAGKIYTIYFSGSTTATITYHVMVDN
ncbi:MAG: DUF4397 domain-containing protein [Sphingobacteriales bacterium]|nr:DUF4397 domain-containing protein [Sphingobacteriales bacterium]